MTEPKKDYAPPAIIFEADLEVKAGSGLFGPTTIDPLEAQLRGWDWPVESDYFPPED